MNLSAYLRNKFGERVQRVPLDAGFCCPNRKGGRSSPGCVYCDSSGSSAPWIKEGMGLREQFDIGASIALRRYGAKKYISYFQSFTNTNAPIEELGAVYREAISFPGVVGLAVSTRPDCLGDDVVALLKELSKTSYVWVEIGAQSMNQRSLDWIRRGHTPQDFIDAVYKLKTAGIETVGHIIFGLPCESRAETMDSYARFIGTGLSGVKIHSLHVIKGTELASMYQKEKFKLPDMDEYAGMVRQALAMTPAGVVIHRVTGEVSPDKLIAPLWVLDKNLVLKKIFGFDTF